MSLREIARAGRSDRLPSKCFQGVVTIQIQLLPARDWSSVHYHLE